MEEDPDRVLAGLIAVVLAEASPARARRNDRDSGR